MSMIEIREVSKTYDNGHPALRGVSVRVARGEFLVLLGESGSGKSTLLKTMNRLVTATSGEVFIEGKPILRQEPHTLRRHIGYVFQDVGLFPHWTVARNIATVPRLLGWSAIRIRERVAELLRLMNLAPEVYAERYPRQLSGGEQQRIGVARALAATPHIMLLDEPFGAVDPLNRERLQREYRQIHDQLALTTVMVTHDMAEALLLADRIAVLHEGRIEQLGTPRELLHSPASDYIGNMLGIPLESAARLASLVQEGRSAPS